MVSCRLAPPNISISISIRSYRRYTYIASFWPKHEKLLFLFRFRFHVRFRFRFVLQFVDSNLIFRYKLVNMYVYNIFCFVCYLVLSVVKKGLTKCYSTSINNLSFSLPYSNPFSFSIVNHGTIVLVSVWFPL